MQLLWEKNWKFFRKFNIELPFDLVILLLGMYPRPIKTYVYVVHEHLPADVHPVRIDKQYGARPYVGILFGKERSTGYATTQMHLRSIILSEESSHKRPCIISLI